RPTKKSTKASTRGVVIRETPEMPLSKKKKKITVEKHKEIDMLSEVALTKEAQFKEVRKKSMRDFHKTHSSGSSAVTKIDPSVAKIKSFVTSEGTGDEDEEMDYTTSQLYDDVDIRLNERIDIDKGFVQEKGIDATMTNV
nr:hypothetical protein [Tanacetum cinerariifolium]